jgi:lipopolysaccharide/colanic/teichoic acid biosynthesis glycosyltransferase
MPFLVKSYDDLQRQRLAVKPGITGLWQVSPDRAEPIHAHMDYDIYYIRHQSLLLDLAILLKTGSSVVRGKGAY